MNLNKHSKHVLGVMTSTHSKVPGFKFATRVVAIAIIANKINKKLVFSKGFFYE